MTNKYRKQIFKISEGMKSGVPSTILQQAKMAEQQSRLKTEILKRTPSRYNKTSQGIAKNSSIHGLHASGSKR